MRAAGERPRVGSHRDARSDLRVVRTAHGAGSCRALERKTWGDGRSTITAGIRRSQGLSADQVRSVNEHFAPLRRSAWLIQARRMTPPDAQRYEVRWVVFTTGASGKCT